MFLVRALFEVVCGDCLAALFGSVRLLLCASVLGLGLVVGCALRLLLSTSWVALPSVARLLPAPPCRGVQQVCTWPSQRRVASGSDEQPCSVGGGPALWLRRCGYVCPSGSHACPSLVLARGPSGKVAG